jgi:hypothetical protein
MIDMMQAKTYAVLEMAIQQGVHSGIYRAYKHVEDREVPHDWQIEEIIRSVEASIHEWFDFRPIEEN